MDPATSPAFPALPPVPDAKEALLCDERAWPYRSACAAGGGIVHLRVWKAGDGGHVAIATETGLGTSTTNSLGRAHRVLPRRPGPAGAPARW